MTIGQRLKSERKRVRLSQPALAALAQASKSAVISWENGSTAPTATALAEMAEAGLDVLYIITGRRLPDRLDYNDEMLRSQLDDIRRDIVEAGQKRLPNESEATAEERVLREAGKKLDAILRYEGPAGLAPDLVTQASALLEIVENPSRLSLFRATDFASTRKRLEEERELLAIWLEGSTPYQPDDAPMRIMATMSLEYRVPHKMLAELAHEIYTDLEEQRAAEAIMHLHEDEVAQSRKSPKT